MKTPLGISASIFIIKITNKHTHNRELTHVGMSCLGDPRRMPHAQPHSSPGHGQSPHFCETPAPRELLHGSSTAGTSLSHINTSGTGTICMSNSQIKHVNRWQVNILIHTVFLLLVSSWQLKTVTPKSAKNNTQSGPAFKLFFSSNFALIFCSTLLIMKLTWPRNYCYNFKVTSEIPMTYEHDTGKDSWSFCLSPWN